MNPWHEAQVLPIPVEGTEAYQFRTFVTGAACADLGDCFQPHLTWEHSIRFEPRYVDPFKAVTDALQLQWEVLQDLHQCSLDNQGFWPHVTEFHVAHSQRPHSALRRQVQFEDHIEVHIGAEDCLTMSCLKLHCSVIHDWKEKPWSKKRIRPPFRSDMKETSPQAPLSFKAVSSRVGEVTNDVVDLMQLHTLVQTEYKQSPYTGGDEVMLDAFRQGHTQAIASDDSPDERYDQHDSDSSSSNSISVDPGSQHATRENRQEVILYHLQDLPIRTFLVWDGYEEMMTEIAHHYAVDRTQLVDAYEVVTPLPDLDSNIVPIVVHMRFDFPPYHLSKLALLDLELHGHKVENHFQTGPLLQRRVIVVPTLVGRQGLLRAADVDRYCTSEQGRCLVFYNHHRWPDYDASARIMSHADHVRVAVPPSEGFACPTEDLVQMRQEGMTDDEVIHAIYNEGVLSGYSPSLLDDQEVRALATPNIEDEDDLFLAFQTSHKVVTGRNAADRQSGFPPKCVAQAVTPQNDEDDHFMAMQQDPPTVIVSDFNFASGSNSSDSIPDDWALDLQRLVAPHAATCQDNLQAEFVFTVYVWFLDHTCNTLCRTPKLATLGGDPSEWREALLYPWRWQLRQEDSVLIDLALPQSVRGDNEDHLFHIILTQRPEPGFSSILLVMEFPKDANGEGPCILIRFAAVVPKVCTASDVARAVPLYNSFALNRIVWEHPALTQQEQAFDTWHGLCIHVRVLPENDLPEDDPGELGCLLQSFSRVSDTKQPRGCSLTDEFLRIVQAAADAPPDEVMIGNPDAIENQPQFIQALWERSFDARANVSLDPTEHVRVESWFLDHTSSPRCHASRITLLGTDFLRWNQLIKDTWNDKIDPTSDDITFAIVHPESEDAASGIIAQLIMTQRAQIALRSTLMSVYDSDPDNERNPYTFAIVLPDSIRLSDVLLTLNLLAECPPADAHNRCSLWFGSIPIHHNQVVNVHSGYAFRTVISRGVALDLPRLLAMDDVLLRRTLQQAFSVQVYHRPETPAFLRNHAPDDEVIDLPLPRPFDGRPEWIQQLQTLFNHHHQWDTDNWQSSLTTLTWYLNHEHGHHCDRPRPVIITEDSLMWRNDLIFPWRDSFLRATPFEFWVVGGTPLRPDGLNVEPHVLLGQGLRNDQVPTLICLEGHTRNTCFAHIFPASVRCRDIARFAVPAEHAHLPVTMHCRGMTYLWDDSIHLQPGDYICITVHSAEFESYPSQIADDTSFMQQGAPILQSSAAQASSTGNGSTAPAPCFNFDPNAPAFQPGVSPLALQTEFVQTLHDIWTNAAVTWEGETPSTKVLVWFVDHRFPFPKCHEPREVRLFEDFTDWEERIKVAWQELLIPTLPLEFTVVQPSPPILEHDIAAHIILIQNPRDDWATSLVSICDPALGPAMPVRMAITTPEHITFELIVHSVYYDDICILRAEPAQCVVWYQQHPILPGHPIPGWSGYSIVLHVNRNPQPQRVVQMADDDAVNLLQRPPSFPPGQTELPERTSQSDELKIDFAGVLEAIAWLDQHFTLPSFDVEVVLAEQAHWLPQCLDWLRLDWFQWNGPVERIQIYYDGSYIQQTGQAGSAAVAFVLQQDQWKFAGAVSALLPSPAQGSYTAELVASLLASKFAFDLAKLTVEVFHATPNIDFVFDSLTVGKQAQGLWQAKRDVLTCHAIRSIICIIEKRWKLQCCHSFIPGHCGEPGNEIADTIANCAARGFPLQNWQSFLEHVGNKQFVRDIAWAWSFFAQLGLRWEDDQLVLPAQPSTHPICSEVLPVGKDSDHNQATTGLVQLQLLTCNVLTLLPGKDSSHECGIGGPARLQSLLAQLHEAEVSVFAFQETRLRYKLRLNSDDYFLFHSPANDKGHFGMLVGFSKTDPFVFEEHQRAHPQGRFAESDFAILAAEPRLVILRVSNAFIKCILIAAHAPHSGAAERDIEAYWQGISDLIPAKYDHWPRIMLADANSRFGCNPNRHIGSHGAEAHTGKGDAFEQFVAAHQLFLPATFPELHSGPTGTWRHTNGSWTRNDIIGLPFDWPFLQCKSWTDVDIDISLTKDDHRPARVHIQWHAQARSLDRTQHKPRKCPPHFDIGALTQLCASLPNICQVDVHTHFSQLSSSIAACTRRPVDQIIARPNRPNMTRSTWVLVCAKRKWRSTLAHTQKLQHTTTLQTFFAAWKHAKVGASFDAALQEFEGLIVQLDHDIAYALHHFRRHGKAVVQALRADDVAFYSGLAQESSQCLGPSDARRFWKALRRHIPKFRQRRQGFDPLCIESLEDQWLPHFCQLEVGEPIDPVALLEACHNRQLSTPPAQVKFCAGDLPSLIQLEDVLRQTQPHRATGYDTIPSILFHEHPCELAELFFPLLLKIMTWQHEPIAGKGGPLAVLLKKGSAYLASNYRGIMLLPTFTKRVHALIRSQLMSLLERQRPPGQIGGFSHQQVMYGSQSLQIFGRIMDRHQMTSAVLFLDLTTAFHRLIREWVSGIHVSEDLEKVLHSLEEEGIPIEEMCQRLQLPDLLVQLDAPPFLRQLMQDIHAGTWMTIGHKGATVHTKRGTRPGSPLADCVFHILMADILHHLQVWIDQQIEYQSILQQFDVHGGFVAWADDLAIPWATRTAAEMPAALRKILQAVALLFRQKGFLLNFDKGKTSAVVTFRGPQAPQLRQEFQLGPKPGDVLDFEGQRIFLHYVHTYKHLGTIFASDHSLDAEIHQRIGLAHAAFGQIAKPILCNRHLPEKVRTQLFQTLIGTKLFFGLGAWITPTFRQMAKIRAFLLRLLRKVLRLTPDEVMTTTSAEIFRRAGQPDPRVRLATDRLLYAQRLWAYGPMELQHIIHREHALCPTSWLQGLLADLTWMKKLEPEGSPFLVIDCDDLTNLLDYWQSDTQQWQQRVKAAFRRHLLQETMMFKMHRLHSQFIDILQTKAELRNVTPLTNRDAREFSCFCGRVFCTPQGLAAHRRLQHNIGSMEKHLIDGATCPCCLKFLWTRQRLYQHLSYIPRQTKFNHCFQTLQKQGFTVLDEIELPVHNRPQGLHRVEAVQALGPRPLFQNRASQELQTTRHRLSQCVDALTIKDTPDDAEQAMIDFHLRLTATTLQWFGAFQANGFDNETIRVLPDSWLDLAADQDPQFGDWLEMVYITWGEQCLADVIATFVDGEAEKLVEEAYTDMIYDFPRMQTMTEITFLRQKIRRLETEQSMTVPHRNVKTGSANVSERTATALEVQSLFQDQSQWLQQVRTIAFDTVPDIATIPAQVEQVTNLPLFLVVHLFSGRRRSTDLHACLEAFATEKGFRVQVLSLDTAVSGFYGNLQMEHPTWKHLLQLYCAGRVAATMVGSPCETFSAARHHQPADIPDDFTGRWPRPLRSSLRFFGLDGLTFRELRQACQGSEFFLQGMVIAAWTVCFGGIYLSEHPWKPEDPLKVSIWTSPWVELLLKLPQTSLHRVCQWRWGAEVSKPTGILAINCPRFASSMYKRQLPDVQKPHKIAIGKDCSTGLFRTAVLKEYPAAFSKALAGALADQLAFVMHRRTYSAGSLAHHATETWLHEALLDCTAIRDTAHFLPDYQA